MKNIYVAYSGGVDSHVLLHLAKQAFPDVKAIHINHAVDTEDHKTQQHCEMICAQLNIPLRCIQVALNIKTDQSIETAARNARRTAWQEMLGEDDLLLLAHHADDQAETILFRLLRGTGPRGLTGMRMASKIGVVKVLRPLLNTSKQEILNYAARHNLQWIEDLTNKDLNITRNYLRQQIMPLLQQRWPAAVANINRAGELSQQLMQGIEPFLNEKLEKICHPGQDAQRHSSWDLSNESLDLKQFLQESLFWQQELLRAWLKRFDLIPSAKLLQLIFTQVIAARHDAQPQLQLADKLIKRSNNKLFVVENTVPNTLNFNVTWDLTQDLQLPDGRCLTTKQVFSSQEQIKQFADQQVTVRMGVLGRKAKKVFQQHQIPPWERASFPLVFVNDRLVSVVGLWNTPRQ